MEKFGQVDFVLADYDEERHQIGQFLSVELQAVDITRSVVPAYDALTNSRQIDHTFGYGFNWANVRKRFLSQLVEKGFYHNQWEAKLVAVIQTDLFAEFQKHASVPTVSIKEANIIFMLYQYARTRDRWVLRLDKVVPTSHTMVMNSVLYQTMPSKDEFKRRIIEKIENGG